MTAHLTLLILLKLTKEIERYNTNDEQIDETIFSDHIDLGTLFQHNPFLSSLDTFLLQNSKQKYQGKSKQTQKGLQIFLNKALPHRQTVNEQQHCQMQKLRTRSQVRLFDKQLLPSLKATNSVLTRTMLPVSKFDLDSNLVLKEQRKLKMFSKVEFTHQKNVQEDYKNRTASRIKRNVVEINLPVEKIYKITTSEFRKERKTETPARTEDLFETRERTTPVRPLVNVQPSKTSSKHYCNVRGYAANSHPGLYNLINEDRICIVTNLNKTNVKPKQISFFGIYDGCNGLKKADYFRDNFHVILNGEQKLHEQPERAIQSTIHKIEKNIASQVLYSEDESKTGFAILVAIGQAGYLVVSEPCQIVTSKKLAEKVDVISMTNPSNKGYFSKLQLPKPKIFPRKEDTTSICIRKIDLKQKYDFIALGSEGIFQCFKPEEVAHKLWSNLMKSQKDNIHAWLGDASTQLLYQVFSQNSTKNASLIILGFQNIEQCLKKQEEKLQLPYMEV